MRSQSKWTGSASTRGQLKRDGAVLADRQCRAGPPIGRIRRPVRSWCRSRAPPATDSSKSIHSKYSSSKAGYGDVDLNRRIAGGPVQNQGRILEPMKSRSYPAGTSPLKRVNLRKTGCCGVIGRWSVDRMRPRGVVSRQKVSVRSMVLEAQHSFHHKSSRRDHVSHHVRARKLKVRARFHLGRRGLGRSVCFTRGGSSSRPASGGRILRLRRSPNAGGGSAGDRGFAFARGSRAGRGDSAYPAYLEGVP